jgi:septal ring factor EnvC (AmiA/AmiB activator)
MIKIVVSFILIFTFDVNGSFAQVPATSEQQNLEKQRQQLKREIEETQNLLDKNKRTTKESISKLALINKKLNLQENMLENINRDINLLDNTIYKSQRDINKMELLLDTLKEDYAKSMVYSYKNRGNADFLNFIFSSSNFNDAIKRITYLKSYRNYREIQGENILRTQEMLRSRISELNGSKEKKSAVLQIKGKEVNILQTQQEEKNQVVKQLKAQGKELNNQVAAKKKQMQKVSNAITAAIRRAVAEAKKETAAKALAEKKLRDAEIKTAKAKTDTKADLATNKPIVKAPPKETSSAPATNRSVLLNSNADIALNDNFIKNKGILPWPIDKGYLLLHYGANKVGDITIVSDGISIACDIGAPVKIIFGGEVALVSNIDDVQLLVVKHGSYFTGYSNLTGVSLSKGQMVQTGQVVGKVAANLDGIGAMDLIITNEKSGGLNPEQWLRRR